MRGAGRGKGATKKVFEQVERVGLLPRCDIYLTYREMTRSEALAVERIVPEYERDPLTEKEIENIKKVLNCPTCPRYYCLNMDCFADTYSSDRQFFDEEFSCQCDMFLEEEEEDEKEIPTNNLTPN